MIMVIFKGVDGIKGTERINERRISTQCNYLIKFNNIKKIFFANIKYFIYVLL